MSTRSVATPNALLDKCLPLTEADRPGFSEPWEARAFALVLLLNQNGVFSWSEWVDFFSKEVNAATQAEAQGATAPSYYAQWIAAAEKIMIAKGMASAPQLVARQFAAGAVATGHSVPRPS